jgi:O-antigen ligase
MNFLSFDYKTILKFLLIIFTIELFSFVGFLNPLFLKIIFLGAIFLVVFLAVKKPRLALLIVLAELVVGSKGYLLYWSLNEGNLISWRLIAWSAFMLIFAIKFLWQLKKDKKNSAYLQNIKNFSFIKPFLYLAGVLFLGLISAFIYRQGILNIFLDFNNWLYFLLLIPIIALRPSRQELSFILLVGAIWISLKTLGLLFIFSNKLLISPTVYEWLRRTLVGEMTILDGWNRVFIQSQSFVVIAYLFLVAKSKEFYQKWRFKKIISWLPFIVGGLFFSTIVISLSRSFWVGLLVAALSFLLIIILRRDFKNIKRYLTFFIVSVLLAVLFIFLAIPRDSQQQFDKQIAGRVGNQEEAAVFSRWSLLPPLFKEIMKNPVTGQGFGATVTYISSDPRVLEKSQEGLYTTYAFEWGYLDIWLKTGIIGVLAYLFLLISLILAAWRLFINTNDNFYIGIILGIIFLATTHFFTPYLNHPLGIGFIIASSCLICKNKVY